MNEGQAMKRNPHEIEAPRQSAEVLSSTFPIYAALHSGGGIRRLLGSGGLLPRHDPAFRMVPIFRRRHTK